MTRNQAVLPPAFSRWIWVVLAVFIALAASVRPFLVTGGDRPYLALYADDFFYYLKVAQNIAEGKGSTFDGFTLTNGYHPLWTGILALLCKVASPDGVGFFYLLQGLTFLLILAAVYLVWRLLREELGVEASVAGVATVVFTSLHAVQAAIGMENLVGVPLLFLALILLSRLLREPTPKAGVAFGVAAALAVFGRIDILLFFALLGVVLFAQRHLKDRQTRTSILIAYGVIGAAFLVYLLWNKAAFGSAMPISGAAKQVNQKGFVNVASIKPFFSGMGMLIFFGGPLVLTILTGLAYLAKPKEPVEEGLAARRPILTTTFVWVPIFFLVHLTTTQYPLYPWYFYPVAVAVPIALGWLLAQLSFTPARILAAGLLLVVCGRTAMGLKPPRPESNTIFTAAQRLSEWAKTHPGRYAMGDRAGYVGFLLGHPVVHLEGLVGDVNMLGYLRSEADLKEVFDHYKVDYYVRSIRPEGKPGPDGCYEAIEPWNIQGNRTKRMHGQLCAEPVLRFKTPDDVETTVFAVRKTP